MSLARTISPAAAAFATVALAAPASASGVDYGALEALFQEPVTTSATGAPQRVTEAPVNMTIISQEEIRRSGAIDIPGVLERLAGLDVDRYFRGQAEVSVRGYNQPHVPRLLVLVNGRQVYLDHYGQTNWDLIPVQLSEIRQIEVVRGPNTALFGFNAVAGVVNILTYDALKDDVNVAEVTAGEPDYFSASGVFTGKIGERIGVRASMGSLDSEGWDPVDIYRSFDPKKRAFALASAMQITPKVRADLEATWGLNERTEVLGYGAEAIPQFESNSFRAAISADTDFGLLQGQVYSNLLDVSYPVPNTNPPAQLALDNRITVGNLSLVARPAAAHVVRIAGEVRRNTYKQAPAERGELAYDVYALSGMWNWQISDDLSLTTALRVDNMQLSRSGPNEFPLFPLTNRDYDRELTEVSANVGAVYKLTDEDTLRLSYARGVQSPSLIGLGIQLPVPIGRNTVILSGNPNLSPTIVSNVEFGWDRDIKAIDGRVRAAVYWQRNEDFPASNVRLQPLMQLGPGRMLLAGFAGNVGDSDSVGMELSVDGERGPLRWGFTYAYRDVQDALTLPRTAIPLDFENSTPPLIFTANGDYTVGRFEIGGDARWVSDHQSPLGLAAPYRWVPIDAFWMVNLRMGVNITDAVAASLTVRNLTDDHTRTTSRSPYERSTYLTLRAKF